MSRQISEHKSRLTGARGLWTAVLVVAVEDAGRPGKLPAGVVADARAYLAGRAGLYQAHLARLDLHEDLWPTEFETDETEH